MTERLSIITIPRKTEIAKQQRTSLPGKVPSKDNFSIWEVVKSNIGKDFARFAVPVYMNEPLCFLQRLSEYMQYIDLVNKAAKEANPVQRLALIGAFAVSALSSNHNRLSKPFNPLLLETYELERLEWRRPILPMTCSENYHFVAEQVSHHPPVSALFAESDVFTLHGVISPKISIWLNKLTCSPQARLKLTLKATGETYEWESPQCSIMGVVMGKMYMDMSGSMIIRSSTDELRMELNFGGRGWQTTTTDLHVDGWICQGKQKVRGVYGNWAHFLAICEVSTLKELHPQWQKSFKQIHKEPKINMDKTVLLQGSSVVWVANNLPPDCEKQYYMSYFALSLNEAGHPNLPPTDSRRRPDIKALERGAVDTAETFKHALEESQRVRRKEGVGCVPVWFTKDGDTWRFTGKYWERDWKPCTAIFCHDGTASTLSDLA